VGGDVELALGKDEQRRSGIASADCPFADRPAVSRMVTALLLLVQGSDASNATKLLARSPGSRLPASAVTTAPPRGCFINRPKCAVRRVVGELNVIGLQIKTLSQKTGVLSGPDLWCPTTY
jgi:hypothetical protein